MAGSVMLGGIVTRIKDNPYIAIIAMVIAAVVSVASFADAVKKISEFITPEHKVGSELYLALNDNLNELDVVMNRIGQLGKNWTTSTRTVLGIEIEDFDAKASAVCGISMRTEISKLRDQSVREELNNACDCVLRVEQLAKLVPPDPAIAMAAGCDATHYSKLLHEKLIALSKS